MQRARIQEQYSLFRQGRVGKGGKKITFTKFRTMFTKEQMKKRKGLSRVETGKPKRDPRENDPRVIPSKKWLRRFWIDELPQLLLLIKGDLRLIGMRAKTRGEFDKMPEWLKQKYMEYGPALIPLKYSMQKTPITEQDFRKMYETYFSEKESRPKYTDFKYFVKFLLNALRGKARGY